MTSSHSTEHARRPRQLLSCAGVLFAALLAVMPPVAAPAQVLRPSGDAAVSETVLSDGLGAGRGAWRSRTQVIFAPGTQNIERRLYEVFDPAPGRDLDFSWQADDLKADRPGKVSGAGRLIWREKDAPVHSDAGIVAVYRGAMREGKPEGQGLYATRDGLMYEGQWRDGRPGGRGRLVLPDGAQYEGAFRDGFAEGEGVFTEPTWERFEGRFRHGRREGVGKTILPSGLSYQSEWRAGRETAGSRRIRIAQMGATPFVGGTDDVKFAITMKRNPRLPAGVQAQDVLRYAMVPRDGELAVLPDDARLVSRWLNGAELTDTTMGGETSPVRIGLFGIYQGYTQPASFDIGFQNNSRRPIEIATIEIQSEKSFAELAPPLDLKSAFCSECGVSFNPTFMILNYGPAPAAQATLRFAFSDPGGGRGGTFTVNLGNIVDRTTVDLTPQLVASKVDVRALAAVRDTGLNCQLGSSEACLAAIRRRPELGTLANLVSLRGATVQVLVRGELDYAWTDAERRPQRRTVSLSVPIGLAHLFNVAEAGSEGPPDAVRADPVRLRLQTTPYVLSVPFRSPPIPPGRVQNYTLEVDAEVSSWHRFRVVAVLSDGRRLTSPPMTLLYFSPKQVVTE